MPSITSDNKMCPNAPKKPNTPLHVREERHVDSDSKVKKKLNLNDA